MSADDVGFLVALMDGQESIWAIAAADAHANGRIGMYILRPLNTLASYGSGYLPFRIAFVSLYFGNLLLFSVYASRLLKVDVALLLFAILLICQPLAFEHMPPTAYALQNTLPIMLLLICRIVMLDMSDKRENVRLLVRSRTLLCIFALSMLVSEYAFVFGTSLLASLYGIKLLQHSNRGERFSASLGSMVRTRAFQSDLAVVAGVFLVYLVFRWFNPSQYDGNSPDGLVEPSRVALTLFGHLLAATVFQNLHDSIVTLPPLALLAAFVCGGLAFVCIFISARRAAEIEKPWPLLFGSLALALYISLPLAVTRKQQAWCIEGSTCGFLDSRIAYLWLCLAGVCFIAVFWRWLSPLLSGRVLSTALAISAAYVAIAGYAHNWRVARQMHMITSAWERADALACNQDRVPSDAAALRMLIDPRGGILMHPNMPAGEYWQAYVDWRQHSSVCPRLADERDAMYRRAMQNPDRYDNLLATGREVHFAGGDGGAFLDESWSSESWGVWSIGGGSSVRLRVEDGSSDLMLSFEIMRAARKVPLGLVSVSVNGKHLAKLQVGSNPQSHELRVPRALLRQSTSGITDIRFSVDDATSPEQDGTGLDKRKLGVGLIRLGLKSAD